MSDSPEALTKVVEESGRWIVWLNVPKWSADSEAELEHPIENCWHRINDYATRSAAEVAARLITRTVNRNFRPKGGY